MIYLLLQYLTHQTAVTIPAVFLYASTRMILAAMTTLLLTISMGPRFINKLYALKTGQSIRVEDCPLLAALHQKKKETPTMGGILILISMLTALLLWMDLRSCFTLILAIATIWLGLVGGMDDYLKMKHKNSGGLRAKKKFALQLLFVILLGLYLLCPSLHRAIHFGHWFSPPAVNYGDYFFPFKKKALFTLGGTGAVLSFIITAVVVSGASNAVNLTDGLDGLASGCVILVAAVLAIVAFLSSNSEMARYLHILYIEGCAEIGVYLCAMGGACLGFLWYNGYPAQVFMGDTGSLALGGILGTAAVLMRLECLLALVGGVFVIEALSVILQVLSYRYRNKKRIFRCTPLHHHFEFKGWSEPKVVVRFWIIGLILALVGLASIKFR
ncbi:MAG: phospho-N-acetylmuramoyl-pentapeptide-transferase [Chlamydiota bacterium]